MPEDILDQSMDVAGYPIRIHPPTASRPYHQIVYRVDGERRVTSGGRTIKTAMDKAATIAARLAADADQARHTVSEFLDAWEDPDRPRPSPWSPKHAAGVRWVLAKRVRPAIGHLTCQELRRRDIQRVVDSAPTPGEGARVRRVLGTALRWGHRHGYLVTAPDRLIGDVHWSGQREVLAHEQGTDPLWVPPDEIPSHNDVAELYKAMAGLCRKGEPTPLAVLVAAYSGVRLGELRALRGSDVDTRRRLIRVTRQVTEVDGVPTPGSPKGRKVRTTVYPPTTPGGIKLSALIVRRARAAGSGLMFPAPRGGFWSATNFYSRRFHPAADAAGWPRAESGRLLWTWHDLRHVFASHYLWDLGATPADVSTAAGHSTVDITLRIYGTRQAGALDRLGALG